MENLYLKNNNPFIISIVATKSGTGKTTLIEQLIKIFKLRKYKVGVLKHDAHKFEIDKEGKDSYKFSKAGADNVIISSYEKLAMIQIQKEEKNIDGIIKFFENIDIVILEGFKSNKYPKIEVHRKEIDNKLLYEDMSFNKETFLAVASNETLNLDIPILNLDDAYSIANFIERKILEKAEKKENYTELLFPKSKTTIDKVLNCNVTKIKQDEVFELNEILVREYALSIFLNSKKLTTLFCSPEKFKELTIGFLRTEGIINSKKDIINLNIDETNGTANVEIKNQDNIKESFHSKKVKLQDNNIDFFDDINCKPVDSNITLKFNKVFEFMKKNLDYSEVFKTTGGVHCVSLCDTEDIRVISEDVARHNALDKVIGEAIIKDISLKDKILILSGRVSLEMILKAAKLQIPIIISKSAPTSLSLELAKRLNITLIGFVRGNKMNIYANKQRILF